MLVELDDVKKGSFLKLQDLTGKNLFKKVLENDKYEAALDFEVIPVGTYFLEYENDRYVRTSVIKKTKNGLEIKGTPEVAFKPSFKVEDNMVVVFLTNHK